MLVLIRVLQKACFLMLYCRYEPTSMRAIRARYNPYVQARTRVDQLRKLGHTVDKVGRGEMLMCVW